jgi:hypothetical protein
LVTTRRSRCKVTQGVGLPACRAELKSGPLSPRIAYQRLRSARTRPAPAGAAPRPLAAPAVRRTALDGGAGQRQCGDCPG